MESFTKENEFAKLIVQPEAITSLVKSRFIRIFYYYTFSSPGGVEISFLPSDVKKVKIQSTKVINVVFILLAILFAGAGYIYSIDSGSSALITGIILAGLSLFSGFLFSRSKAGKMRVMWMYLRGSIVVLYASQDTAELHTLRQSLENK